MTALSPHQILKEYWGYDNFRPQQEEVINSILDGNDALALMPTGGGKSICFQIPALSKPGICIVVSPLIALMKDQVENLRSREILAEAIYSGLSFRQISLSLNNCISGQIKFLYLSPERLKSSLVREFIRQLDVSLIAVDEAHCISQWGFDFRPEYRQIAEIREFFPGVPVLALTATATKDVVADIQEQLGFKKTNVFRRSFERKNLSYVVRVAENKDEQMLNILKKVKGSALIYVRNRRKTEMLARLISENHMRADYYHAGLHPLKRTIKQDAWIKGKTRIMVCTNAFGMGIDKADCRLVIHYEMPDCLEAYYQEAGRAGRDENRAYCVLLFNEADKAEMQSRFEINFPPEKEIRRVYNALCNNFNVPVGNNFDISFDFDLYAFVKKYNLKTQIAYSSIKILEQSDLINLSETFFEPSKIRIMMDHQALYKFQVENKKYDDLIKLILRSYGGMFDHYVTINEDFIAKKYRLPLLEIKKALNKLAEYSVLDYCEQKETAQLSFTSERIDDSHISFEKSLLKIRKEVYKRKLDAMVNYSETNSICRSKTILEYFDEFDSMDCGCCDICIDRHKKLLSDNRAQEIENLIKDKLDQNPMDLKDLYKILASIKEDELSLIVRFLLDKGKLRYNSKQELIWI